MLNVITAVNRKNGNLDIVMEGDREPIPYNTSTNDRHLTFTLTEAEAVCLLSDLMNALHPHGSIGDKSPKQMADLILEEHRGNNSPAAMGYTQLSKCALITVSFAMAHDRSSAVPYWKEVQQILQKEGSIQPSESEHPLSHWDSVLSFSMMNEPTDKGIKADLLLQGNAELLCKGLLAKMDMHESLVDCIMTVACTWWNEHPEYIQKIPLFE